MTQKRINLAVCFYGNRDQQKTNQRQFLELQKVLVSFDLHKYNFSSQKSRLLSDFKKGKIGLALKNSYGRGNEAVVETFLQVNKIPYLGSGPRATLVATSKLLSKKLFSTHNLPLLPHVYLKNSTWQKNKNLVIRKVKKINGFPCIVKDVSGTDSRGIFICLTSQELELILNKNIEKVPGFIIEPYIALSKEITCFVSGKDKVSVYEPVEILHGGKIFSKSIKDKAVMHYRIPAQLSKKTITKIKTVAKKAHLLLRGKDFSRSDFLVKNNKIFLLETDVHPGFRDSSPTTAVLAYAGSSRNNLFVKLAKENLKGYK